MAYARAAQCACAAAAALVFGYLSNRKSTRVLISVSMGVSALGVALFIALRNVAMLVVAYCLTGFGYGTRPPIRVPGDGGGGGGGGLASVC